MTSETVSLIVKIASVCVTCVTSMLAIISTYKGGKWKELFHSVNAVNDKTKILLDLIAEAETHGAYTGADKLQFVLSKFIVYCTSNKIKYDEASVTEQINELVNLTKKVNNGRTNKNRFE